jgi:hypothetical protein
MEATPFLSYLQENRQHLIRSNNPMPITATCTCGNRMGVSDALAGKTIRCTACGQGVFVNAAAPAPAAGKKPAKSTTIKGASGKNVQVYQQRASTIAISGGQIRGLAIVGGIVLLIAACILGPVRVYEKWQSMETKVNSDVSDVITFGLQAYLSNQGEYDPKFQHMSPHVDGPCVFLGPVISFTMPERIVFRGKSTQGDFMGVYNTRTGDVDADVYYGGYTVAGMLDIAKPTGKFHMTGRMANGFPQAEVDGQSLQIVSQSLPNQ